ncbi:3-deoxy-D-manno-octulosonic acid transferase [Devosia sp.]|uniref:3-deoxy-D-manno-octulosonic acid transferase n=1 Tax=Devosia sp. TaxID=1871048 RepID=UPI003BAAD756
MAERPTFRWRAYGWLVEALSFLHYAVLSRFSQSDEGGTAWLNKRRNPVLPGPAAGRRIWIHAVSAGETKVAELLRSELLRQDPGLSVVLSATTYAGHARIRAIAGDAASFIMPLDTPAAQQRVFATVRPNLLVLVESEYWPAQLAAAADAGVPVVVVNATVSERSFARHTRFPALCRLTLMRADRIYAQDAATLERCIALGVGRDRLEISGNLKLASPVRPPGQRTGPPLITFGNVHRAELPALASAIAELARQLLDVQIALVPRYPGRIPEDDLRTALGPALAIITDAKDMAGSGPLVWLNQMGMLSQVYARSTIGVVCGTFAPIGGHDLAEPLQQGAASVYGPHVERQRVLEATLAELAAGTHLASAADLPAAVAKLLDDPAGRDAMINRFATASLAAEKRLNEIAAALRARL